MRAEEGQFLLFFWILPSIAIGVILGFSEHFGHQLGDCEPKIAPWLRIGLVQNMLLSFGLMLANFLPRKYTVYFDRFLNQGYVSFALAFIFVALQILTPWITLTLYLLLKKKCDSQISSGMTVFYWVLFSLQAMLFTVASVMMFFFCRILDEDILSAEARVQQKRSYLKQAER